MIFVAEKDMASKYKTNGGSSFISGRKLIGFAGVAIVALYLLYLWTSSKSKDVQSKIRTFAGWKTFDFTDIPIDVQERAKSVVIEERQLSFDFDGQKFDIFFLEVRGGSNKLPPVLMLHGAGSSSAIFKQIGTLNLLGALGNRAVAMDLPGHGGSSHIRVGDEMAGRFLAEFIQRENLHAPVIISASMSGRYVIPYMMYPQPNTCQERMRAFIPLAPVRTESFTHAEYHRCEIPVLITYGEKDKTFGLQSTGNLRNMPNSDIFPLSGAGHAHYEDKPKEWHHLLYNFMEAVNHDRT